MMNRKAIFTAAHQIAKANKVYWPHESYRDLFAAALAEAHKQAKAEAAAKAKAEAEIEAEEAQLTEQKTNLETQLTICTAMLDDAHARNDYCEIEQHKLGRQEIQRYLRNIDQRLEELAQTRRCLLAA